jgi:hypothetical protein
MALLGLRRVGLCVGQNQMCHLRTGLLIFLGVRELRLCGWLKIELKKCAVGKIKNTEGSAMSVGSVAVQLKYGLYVGHLSKLAFHFMFIVVCLFVLCRLLGLLVTVPGFVLGGLDGSGFDWNSQFKYSKKYE